MNSSYTSSTTSAMRASGRSTLLTTRITGSRASSALRSTKRVCGSGPSDASTSSSTPSTIVSPRSTSPPKSAWPGVSTMLSLTPPWWMAVFLARIVIPFSRSRSIESITRSPTSCPFRKAPVCHSILSTSVVLPWSTWATIATFRRSVRRLMALRIALLSCPAMKHRTARDKKNGTHRSGSRFAARNRRLRGLLNARRGGAFGPFLGLVADLGALGQGLESLAEDRAVMDEHVLRAVVGRDEPVALIVAEPLDCSSGHALPPLHCAANAEDAVKQRRER